MTITNTLSNRLGQSLPGLLDAASLAALWCVCVFFIQPWGDFPLNDDWSFALAVKHFLDTGELRPSGWAAMTLMTNVLWGSVFTHFAGMSFDALRLSSLVAGCLGSVVAYLICRVLEASRFKAWLVAATLALSPLYLALSHTFMTDIFFCMVLLLSVLCLVRCLHTQDWTNWSLGVALLLVATMSRQLAVSVSVAFAVAQLWRGGLRGSSLAKALIPVLICAAAWQWFQSYMIGKGWLPPLFVQTQQMAIDALQSPHLFQNLLKNTTLALLTIGFLMLPVSLFVSIEQLGSRRPLFRWQALALVVWLACLVWLSRSEGVRSLGLPNLGNVLDASGIGPFTLHDMYIEGRVRHVSPLPAGYWFISTTLAALGVIGLMALVMQGISHLVGSLLWRRQVNSRLLSPNQAVFFFLVLASASLLFPALLSAMYDRYMLPVAALLMLVYVGHFPDLSVRPSQLTGRGLAWLRGVAALLALAALSLMGAFSVAAVHDYLAWNRARWQLLSHLTHEMQIPANYIDGGMEFNGLYLYSPDYQVQPGKSWWWVQDDAIRLTFGEQPGYVPYKVITYPRWLTGREEPVMALRRMQPIADQQSPTH